MHNKRGSMTINDLIYQTVEDSEKPRAEIADDCGDLYSNFSRKVNPNDPVRFPAEQIVPLIRSTRDPRIIEFMVERTSDITGLILVKDRPRRVVFDPSDYAHHMTIITDHQEALSRFVQGKADVDEAIKKLDALRSELLAIRRAVLSKNRQKDLF